jgi:hypothetical protein
MSENKTPTASESRKSKNFEASENTNNENKMAARKKTSSV